MFHIGNSRVSIAKRFTCADEAVRWRNVLMPKTGMVFPLFAQCKCRRCRWKCPSCGQIHDDELCD